MGDINTFVCGHPILHSRSPLIHNHWIREHGLSGSYRAIDVAPDDFAAFVSNLGSSGLGGGNVTIPHKEQAFALAHRKSEIADLIGAANTLWFEGKTLCADNTDAYGFAANLDAVAPSWSRDKDQALVIGAGGASRAVVFALLERGFKTVHVANRTRQRAQELADRFRPGRRSPWFG